MLPLKPNQKILFVGDSITDCDRRGSAAPLGDGYVSMFNNFLQALYPELHLTIVNRGVSGDTTRDLHARWQRDVIDLRPDWLSVGIGINDVWRYFGDDLRSAVPIDEYESTLRLLLDRALTATGAGLIMMEPYMIEPDLSQPMRRKMDLYRARFDVIAADYKAILVPTQVAFDTVLQHTKPEQWADDKIHPNPPGHAVIALAFLKALGAEL
jgi:lysophospholipase L1-like esterase